MEAPPRGLRGMIWIGLLAVCLAALGIADAMLLELSRGTFTTGYNGVALDTAGLRLGFAAASLLLDATFVLVLWGLAIPLLQRIGLARVQVFGLTAALTLGIATGLDIVRYQVHTIVGDLLALGVIWQLAAGNVTAVANSALPDLGSKALALCMVAVAFGVVLAVARFVEHRLEGGSVSFAAPRVATVWLGAGAAALLSLAVLLAPWAAAERAQTALRAKPSAAMLAGLVARATDVDGDGVGLLSRPPDPAPFDGDISPWAL
ncbi:MAG: hypothetical protein O7A09_12660, partial [Proteobacteria bacterium]|nr:hypothetical protein [Pseudomonadota bacterium]